MADVKDLYDEIEELGYLEDRREYSTEDYAKAYPHLSDQEVDDLKYLIDRNFDPGRVSAYKAEDRYDPRLVVTTITEALHQGLDGWTTHEQCVIGRFLDDIMLAVKHSLPTEGNSDDPQAERKS
jgi:hypothetical protein